MSSRLVRLTSLKRDTQFTDGLIHCILSSLLSCKTPKWKYAELSCRKCSFAKNLRNGPTSYVEIWHVVWCLAAKHFAHVMDGTHMNVRAPFSYFGNSQADWGKIWMVTRDPLGRRLTQARCGCTFMSASRFHISEMAGWNEPKSWWWLKTHSLEHLHKPEVKRTCTCTGVLFPLFTTLVFRRPRRLVHITYNI